MSAALNIGNIVKNFDTFCKVGLSNGIKDGCGKTATFCVEAAIDLASRGYTLSKARAEDAKLDEKYQEDGYGPSEIKVTDQPSCVAQWAQSEKIDLNDESWGSDVLRGRALRNVGILQLGTKSIKKGSERFEKLVSEFLKARAKRLCEALLPKNPTWSDIRDSDDVEQFCYVENGGDSGLLDFIVDTGNWTPAKKLRALCGEGYSSTEDYKLVCRTEAFEYALAKLDTPGYKWLVKNEGYKIPTP